MNGQTFNNQGLGVEQFSANSLQVPFSTVAHCHTGP